MKPTLTVRQLVRTGFKRLGCWELNSEQKLTHKIDLPAQKGVYAFAVDGVVQYVGLASTSVRQRLGFYSKPAQSQRTNLRLNDLIRGRIEQGAVVEVLVGHPPEYDWNGLKVSGAEGLEAGLIAQFDLPWNLRGTTNRAVLVPAKSRATNSTDRVLNIIRRRPGMTELDIAKAMYGASAVQQDVNPDCRLLLKLKLVERCGLGGKGDPFTYRITEYAHPGSSPG